jgi:hypothetical protein
MLILTIFLEDFFFNAEYRSYEFPNQKAVDSGVSAWKLLETKESLNRVHESIKE